MSNILVTFGAVDTASADTDAIAGQIDATLDQLKSYLAPLRGTWEGNASLDYQALQSRWDTSAADLNLVLHQIAAALRTAKENYMAAEAHNAGVWSAG